MLKEEERKGIDTLTAIAKLQLEIAGEKWEYKKRHIWGGGKGSFKPLSYGISRIQNFENFLKDFEKYAWSNYGGDKKRWAVRLADFLEGPAQTAYRSCYKVGGSYESLIKKLKRWFASAIDERPIATQKDFWTSDIVRGESISEFAMRLQSLYESVYPPKMRDTEVLLDKFIECLPKETFRSFRVVLGKKRNLRWHQVLEWARDEDLGVSVVHKEW